MPGIDEIDGEPGEKLARLAVVDRLEQPDRFRGVLFLLAGAVALALLGAALGWMKAALGIQPLLSLQYGFGSPVIASIILSMWLDLQFYTMHRFQHRFFWRFHAVHHTSEHLDWLAAHREHPLDGLLTQLSVNLPAIVLGFSLAQIAWLIALRGMWAIFIHSNVRLPLGPLRVLLGAPELHHWHHVRSPRAQNFANLAPWTDLLFGTYHRPTGPETWPLGSDAPLPRSYLGMLARPVWPARFRARATR